MLPAVVEPVRALHLEDRLYGDVYTVHSVVAKSKMMAMNEDPSAVNS